MDLKVITKAQNVSFAKAKDKKHADHIFLQTGCDSEIICA
jgi:hypothetical protein